MTGVIHQNPADSAFSVRDPANEHRIVRRSIPVDAANSAPGRNVDGIAVIRKLAAPIGPAQYRGEHIRARGGYEFAACVWQRIEVRGDQMAPRTIGVAPRQTGGAMGM